MHLHQREIISLLKKTFTYDALVSEYENILVHEMLYFTAYHNQHHLEKLRNQELHAHTWENQLQQLIF